MSHEHRPYAAGLAAVVALLLGACSSGGGVVGPATSPVGTTSAGTVSASTPSASSTSSGSPTASETTDPGVPAAARVQTEAGAEAFTTYFATQANNAYRLNDSTLLTPLVAASCKTCAAMVVQVNKYKRLGQRYVGEVVHPQVTAISAFDPTLSTAKTYVTSSTAAVRVLDQGGKIVATFPASSGALSFFLKYQGGWRITEIKATT